MNRAILYGLVLAAIVALSYSELCTPDQWEGFESVAGGYSEKGRFMHHGHNGRFLEHNCVHYDAKNSRKAMFIDYVNNGRESKFQIVVRYTENSTNSETGKAYIVNLKDNKCWTKTWSKPFRKACLPEDAEHHGDYHLGLKSGGLAVSGFIFEKRGIDAYVTLSKVDNSTMIPVGQNVSGRMGRVSFVQTSQYVDITPGIKDAAVFDIPKACEEDAVLEEDLSDYLMREHMMFSL